MNNKIRCLTIISILSCSGGVFIGLIFHLPSLINSLILDFLSLINKHEQVIIGITFGLIGYSMASAKLIRQGNEAIVERLGRYHRKLVPGLNFIVPLSDKVVVRMDIRQKILEIAPLLVITLDNIPLEIDAVIEWRIFDLERSYYTIKDVELALKNQVITLSREIAAQYTVDKYFLCRSEVDRLVLEHLNEIITSWGIQVSRISLKDIRLSYPVLGELPNTIDFTFHNGINWKAFYESFNFVVEVVENEDVELKVQSIEERENDVIVVKVKIVGSNITAVKQAEIYKEVWSQYEEKLEKTKIFYESHITSLTKITEELAKRDININNVQQVITSNKSNSMSESYQSKYDQRNSNNQFVDTAQTGSNPTFNQSNYAAEQKKTLAEAASEIQKLLNQLEQTNPTATEAEKVAYVNDETTPNFKRRVVGALQASSETAIDEFILENKYLKVAKAAIKGWLQPGS